MRHRQRNTVAPLVTPMATQYYELLTNPNKWIYSAQWDNSPSRVSFPDSRVEHCYDEIHSGPPFLSGGPFNLWSFSTNASIPQGYGVYYSRPIGNMRYKYVGGFTTTYVPETSLFSPILQYKNPGNPTNFPGGEHTWGDVSAYGPIAWKRYRPGKSSAEAGIFLGEIRDLPRMLKTTARGFYEAYKGRFGRNPKGKLKKAADHWLNHQFGWVPFVSDLRSFYKTWFNADRIIRQLIEQNGQWQKRMGTVTTSSDSDVLFNGPITRPTGTYLNPQLGDLYLKPGLPNHGWRTLTRITSQRVWFVGRFRYWIPNIGSVQWNRTAVQKLFGLEVTPSLIWELTPWSWLVDWCSNVGDVFSNISNPGLAENLAAKYAYVMGTTSITLNHQIKVNAMQPVTANFTYALSRKVRIAANPFGFGFTWDVLTPRQWSILGALGITRMH